MIHCRYPFQIYIHCVCKWDVDDGSEKQRDLVCALVCCIKEKFPRKLIRYDNGEIDMYKDDPDPQPANTFFIGECIDDRFNACIDGVREKRYRHYNLDAEVSY